MTPTDILLLTLTSYMLLVIVIYYSKDHSDKPSAVNGAERQTAIFPTGTIGRRKIKEVFPMEKPPAARLPKFDLDSPPIPVYVCGWALTWDTILAKAPVPPSTVSRDWHARSFLYKSIDDHGGEFMRATVLNEDGLECLCFAIAHNETKESIEGIKDLDNIARVKAGLGLTEDPKWYWRS